MNQFLQQLINGLSLGSIYALIALGYTMVFGIIRLINFAHGDIYMLGAFMGYIAISYFHFSFFPALIFAMLSSALIGVLAERIAYRPLRKATRIAALITAIGVSFFMQYTTMYFMGAGIKTYPKVLENKLYYFGRLQINQQQIIIFVVSIVLMILLQLLVKKTKIGKAMRAVSLDADAARIMGIDVDRTISYTFALGSALAGAAGILVGLYYNTINPLMGTVPGLKAFIAAVFGGIGVMPGAMFGGFFIGIVETLVSGYGSSMYKDAVVYGILILVLIIKPSGLLGKAEKEKV